MVLAKVTSEDWACEKSPFGPLQNGSVCWKRTGIFDRINVPSTLLPGDVTTTTASLPIERPSGFVTMPLVKVPV